MWLKPLTIGLLSLFMAQSVYGYCPPYGAVIESIVPSYPCLEVVDQGSFCGAHIEIKNNCDDEFYFYDEDGELNKIFILINYEDWNSKTQKYTDINNQSDAEPRGEMNSHEPDFFERDCYNCPDNDSYCEQDNENKKAIYVDGIDVCNKRSLKDGAVVKYWETRLYSLKNREDISIKGKTVYQKPWNPSFFLLGLVSVLVLIYYSIKRFLKVRNVFVAVLVTWLTMSAIVAYILTYF